MTVLDRTASLLAEEEAELLMEVFTDWDNRLLELYMKAEQDCFPPELLYSKEELSERAEIKGFGGMIIYRKESTAAIILVTDDEEKGILYLDTLAVLTRGEGLGSRIMKALVKAARAGGKKGISLDTEHLNSKGQKLVDYYGKLGFSVDRSRCFDDNVHMIQRFSRE